MRLLFLACALLLAGCAALDEVSLPRPTAVPVLARLPSVTPAPPTPTDPPPTPTPIPTATPEPIAATVRVGANVRSGPGTSFEIVGVLNEGERVGLLAASDAWYHVQSGDLDGWMIDEVLLLPEDTSLVPTVTPAP
jgi:hypothetical protein